MAFDNNSVHFGGPDVPKAVLRDLLASRIAAVPPGGEINWATYYFRDRRLAEDLLQAADRGVRVTVVLDPAPRCRDANDEVIEILAGDHRINMMLKRGRRLHAKVYCFTHPEPVAIVGSFNPLCDVPEKHVAIANELGDHDVGFNLLVEMKDPNIVKTLNGYVNWLHGGGVFSRDWNFKGTEDVYLFPRWSVNPIVRLLRESEGNSRIRLVASHLKGGAAERIFSSLANRGSELSVVTDGSLRRTPPTIEKALRSSGVTISRVQYDSECRIPMHCKFLLVDTPNTSWSVFGSFNWNWKSRHWNHEIAVLSRDKSVYEALSARWEDLQSYASHSN